MKLPVNFGWMLTISILFIIMVGIGINNNLQADYWKGEYSGLKAQIGAMPDSISYKRGYVDGYFFAVKTGLKTEILPGVKIIWNPEKILWDSSRGGE